MKIKYMTSARRFNKYCSEKIDFDGLIVYNAKGKDEYSVLRRSDYKRDINAAWQVWSNGESVSYFCQNRNVKAEVMLDYIANHYQKDFEWLLFNKNYLTEVIKCRP